MLGTVVLSTLPPVTVASFTQFGVEVSFGVGSKTTSVVPPPDQWMTLGEKKGAATVPPPPGEPVQPLIVRWWFTSFTPLMELHVTGGADLVAPVPEQALAVATSDAIRIPAAIRRIRTLSPATNAAAVLSARSLSRGRLSCPTSPEWQRLVDAHQRESQGDPRAEIIVSDGALMLANYA